MLLGMALGGVVFAAVGYWFANAKAQSRSAVDDATGAALTSEVASLRVERDALRVDTAAAMRAESAAQALLAASQQSIRELRAQGDVERARAEQLSSLHAEALAELRATQTRVAERESAMQKQLEERERSLTELRRTVEQSRDAMRDAFKATGAELLQVAGDSLLKQAKEQFEGQSKLSAQELDSRHKAMDAAIAPLREQIVKQEELVRSLGEKREGDAKSLGEQLKQIGELQQKALTAAQRLDGALRDNRQRGEWGELALKIVVEMAGLAAGVHFEEQATIDGEEGKLRPDMIVRLPKEGPFERLIAIDSKVPLTAYRKTLEESISDADRKAFRAEHAEAVRGHVRTLASRGYAAAIKGNIEFTVLFIPIESAFTAAFETDASLHEEALRRKVIVVTPSTLLALLRTVALHWSNASLAENAEKIGEEAKELVKRIGTFIKHLNLVGDKLGAATTSYNDALSSFERRLIPSVNRVANLAASEEIELREALDENPKRLALPTGSTESEEQI